jgi:endoglucanase Acf2
MPAIVSSFSMRPFPSAALCAIMTVTAAAAAALAQEPVRVGRGSHAPAPITDKAQEVERQRIYLARDDGRPIPSNKWFQNLLLKQYGTGLWAMPHRVDATPEGIEVFHATAFSGDGVRTLAEWPLVVTGRDFKPQDSRICDWGDWTVRFRCFESDSRFMNVTLGEGMPAVWYEFTGVQPLLALGGQQGRGSRAKRPAAFFDGSAKLATLPTTGDALGVSHEGRNFGIFAPDGTRFEQTDAGIGVTFSGKAAFLIVCPLPDPKDIGFFRRNVFAVPRATQLSWNYDRTAGRVATTWKITAEPLKASAPKSVIQGFLPHHWRENMGQLDLSGPGYTTIRGALRCGVGDTFEMAHAFNGILPNLPPAKNLDTARIKELLAAHFLDPRKQLRGDTYWCGKELQKYAQAAFIAAQVNDAGGAASIAGKLRAGLENWFTFSPPEKESYFACYPRRKALAGFPSAYGSEHFTDTHFHQGYFVFAAALLCGIDREFAAGYGDFARMIAKNYANYDPKDTRFPRFRTFDLWRGHSFADGNGFPEGNNQESTGEAVNSWAALILLGEALGDAEMTAAGVMGYAFESRAALEYWFDPHNDVFPPTYAHDACGMIWSSSIVWGTWFTTSPAWIYGIQWLPSAPHLAFFDRDRSLVARIHAGWQREQEAFEAREAAKKPGVPRKAVDIKSLGGELGSYHLGFLMQADAPRAVAELDKLWKEPGDKVAHSEWMANILFQASALAELGRVDWSCHASSPTAMVFSSPATAQRTLVAWNPANQPQTVAFFEGAKPIGTLTVPPHSMARQPAAAGKAK